MICHIFFMVSDLYPTIVFIVTVIYYPWGGGNLKLKNAYITPLI